MTLTYKQAVALETGYFLEKEAGFLSVYIPEERINYIPNPAMQKSDATATYPDGYLIASHLSSLQEVEGGPFWRSYYTMKAYDTQHWARTSTYTGTLSGPLTASAWIRSETGGELQFQLRLRGTLVNSNTSVTYDSTTFRFKSSEYVQKSFTVTPPEPIKDVQIELRFLPIGFTVQYPSFGGFQLEKGTYATSMIHGYYGEGYSWLGIPFDSPSKRTADALCGGRLVNLRDLGFRLTAVNGLGIPEDFDLNSQPRANGRGSVFTCRSIESREISFEGMLYSCSLDDLLSKRNKLGHAVFSYDKPRCFVWQPLDECDNPLPCVEFTGVLDKGMSFNHATHFGEEIELTFVNFDIELTECGTSCVDLVFKDRVLAQGLVTLDVNGNFVVIPPPPGFQVLKRAEISRYNGKLYIAYNVGGNTRIAEYDGSDWTVIAQSSGSNTALYSYGKYLFAAVDSLGSYSASGAYTGSAPNYFAIIDLQAKTIVGNPGFPTGQVRNGNGTLVNPRINTFVGAGNSLYIGGNFRPLSGLGDDVPDIARLNMLYLNLEETGLSNFFNPLDGTDKNRGGITDMLFIEEKDELWFVGDFNMNMLTSQPTYAQTIFGHSFRTGKDLTKLSSGYWPYVRRNNTTIGVINAIVYYHDSILVGGHFAQIAGQLALGSEDYVRCLAWVNDSGLLQSFDTEIGIKLAASGSTVRDMTVCNDVVYVAGDIEDYGTISPNDNFSYQVTGYGCGVLELESFGSISDAVLNDAGISFEMNNNCVIGFARCFDDNQLSINRIFMNINSAPTNQPTDFAVPNDVFLCGAYLPATPKLYIQNKGRLQRITNESNGTTLNIDYYVLDGEILEIDFEAQPTKLTSSYRGDVSYEVLASSSQLVLEPGIVNKLVVLFEYNTWVDSTHTNDTLKHTQVWACWRDTALAAESLQNDCPTY